MDADVTKLTEDVYAESEKLIRYLSVQAESDNVMMSREDIEGELRVEVVKCVQYYADRNKSRDDIMRLLKVMLSNRLRELRYKYYVTHRKQENLNISIEVSVRIGIDGEPEESMMDIIPDDGPSIEDYVEMRMEMSALRGSLSDTAKIVFDTIMHGSDRFDMLYRLSAVRARASTVRRKSVSNAIRADLIADALFMEYSDVKKALREIRRKSVSVL